MSKIELPPLPAFDFAIEPASVTPPRVMSWESGGCRPATDEECELWDALRARDRQIVELCASLARDLGKEYGEHPEWARTCEDAIRALLDEKKGDE